MNSDGVMESSWIPRISLEAALCVVGGKLVAWVIFMLVLMWAAALTVVMVAVKENSKLKSCDDRLEMVMEAGLNDSGVGGFNL